MNERKTGKNCLDGLHVLVTRPAGGAPDRLVASLKEAGATVTHHPVIHILPAKDSHGLRLALAQLDSFKTIAFFSTAGVTHFLDILDSREIRLPDEIAIAAIGDATARALNDRGFVATLIPEKSNSSSMADCLIENTAEGPILLIRADRGSTVISDRLEAAGIGFHSAVAYRSADVGEAAPDVLAALRSGKIDWITITSSAIARSTITLFGNDLQQVKFACISDISASALRDAGKEPDVVAEDAGFESLVEAIVQAESRN
ncbi:MAG: uroporphyrinogen-III synthase [Planctomycetota bacterium]